MELFLNLCWLLLAIPAAWVWQEARTAQRGQRFQSHRCLLLLACLVVLLFPVISASDDLQAIRPEIEESGARDGLRNAQGHRFLTLLVCHGTTPALLSVKVTADPGWQYEGRPVVRVFSSATESDSPRLAGRAPPVPFPS